MLVKTCVGITIRTNGTARKCAVPEFHGGLHPAGFPFVVRRRLVPPAKVGADPSPLAFASALVLFRQWWFTVVSRTSCSTTPCDSLARGFSVCHGHNPKGFGSGQATPQFGSLK